MARHHRRDDGESRSTDAPADDETRRLLHRTIDAVTERDGPLRFNTAIAKLIELNNHLTKLSRPSRGGRAARADAGAALPHVAEELWRRLGHDDTMAYGRSPMADPALLVEDTVEYPVQVNGKVRSHIIVPADADPTTVEAAALADPKVVAASTAPSRRRSSSSPAGWSTSSSDHPDLRRAPRACVPTGAACRRCLDALTGCGRVTLDVRDRWMIRGAQRGVPGGADLRWAEEIPSVPAADKDCVNRP